MNAAESDLISQFERALGEIRARVSSFEPSVALAYSGGLDSSVLLHLTHRYAATNGIRLFAFHVHHGLSANADDWLEHCRQTCAQLGVQFNASRIRLGDIDRLGVEEAARIGRYAALGALCTQHRISLLLTAHHRDDQAETVVLQLLRGAGVAGLSGMAEAGCSPHLLGSADVLLGRPLLGCSRAQLLAWARENRVAWIDDESNADLRYARNALRQGILPDLRQHFPGFEERIARTARHAQSAQRLLEQLAQIDFAQCADAAGLDLERMRALDTDRIDNLLRYWLGLHGLRMPSAAWISQLRSQVFDARPDAQLCVTYSDVDIRRFRRHLTVQRVRGRRAGAQSQPFSWTGQRKIEFPAFGGSLLFDEAEHGIGANWLRNQALTIGDRSGGEMLKLAANRPRRSLKQHFQALGIPAWERERLPVVTAGGQLLFAAGIGMDCRFFEQQPNRCVTLRWISDE